MNTPLFLLFIVTILGLVFQKSKFVACLIFIFIWTLSWTGSQPDYTNYETMFIDETSADIGYAWISLLFKRLGFDYFTFRLIFLCIGWSIYTWFTIRFSKRCGLVSVIYLWTLSLYDMEQNRNFVAFSICLIGISLLFKNQSLRHQCLYFLIVLIASSIHITCAFFLVFLVLNKNVLNRFSKLQIIAYSSIFAALLLYIFSKQIIDKVDSNSTGVSALTKGLLILLFLLNISFIFYVKRFKTAKVWINRLNNWEKIFSFTNKDTIWLYNLALFLLLPASFLALSSLRIYRYYGLLNICYSSNRLETKSKTLNTLLTILLITYSFSFLMVSYLMHMSSFIFVITPPFFNNVLYGY